MTQRRAVAVGRDTTESIERDSDALRTEGSSGEGMAHLVEQDRHKCRCGPYGDVDT